MFGHRHLYIETLFPRKGNSDCESITNTSVSEVVITAGGSTGSVLEFCYYGLFLLPIIINNSEHLPGDLDPWQGQQSRVLSVALDLPD